MELDRQGTYPIISGRKLASEGFHRIRLVETGGADNLITFYAGPNDIELNAPVNVDGSTVATIVEEDKTPTEGIYLLTADDTPEQIAVGSTLYFRQIVLYPAKAVAAGILSANTGGDIYVGLSATYQPDKRATTDVDYPIVIEAPVGQKIALSRVRVNGKTGDGVFYRYLPG